MASIEAPALPKDFTTARPLAYSSVAPVRSLFASARTGAFCVLYLEITRRNTRDSTAPAMAIRPTFQLIYVSHRRIHTKFR